MARVTRGAVRSEDRWGRGGCPRLRRPRREVMLGVVDAVPAACFRGTRRKWVFLVRNRCRAEEEEEVEEVRRGKGGERGGMCVCMCVCVVFFLQGDFFFLQDCKGVAFLCRVSVLIVGVWVRPWSAP